MLTERKNSPLSETDTLLAPTVEITINLFGSCCMHYCTHIAAVVRNPSEKKAILIEYEKVSAIKEFRLHQIYEFQEKENSCCVSTVKLYSNKNMHDFLKAFNTKFKPKGYCYCSYNCADAVQFLLDYFFPNERCYASLYTGYQLLCCFGFIGSLGLLNCFPAPPCTIVTPTDVYKKAKLLSFSYGNRPENFEEKIVHETKVENAGNDILEDDINLPIEGTQVTAYLENDFHDFETLDSFQQLKFAVLNNNVNKVEEILKASNIDSVFQGDSLTDTPSIFIAVQKQSTAILELLLEKKADVNKGLPHGLITSKVVFAKGTTLLMYAACCNCEDDRILQLLCKYGANVNAKSESGCTALHWATAADITSHIQFFKSKKEVNVKEKNYNAETPEAFAVRLATKLNPYY